jgi:dihydrofolate reductase
MKKTIVVACDEQNTIGKKNQLIWHMPADMKFFRATTMGHHLLMGRKTFESMGGPLIGRTSIVVTRNRHFSVPEGHHLVNSIEEGIELAKNLGVENLMILGGAEIYKQTIDIADVVIMTRIHHSFSGDAFFPKLKPIEWDQIWSEYHDADEKNAYSYTFKKFIRKKN